MFAKMKAKTTLAETYEEAERVEAERESIEDYPVRRKKCGEESFVVYQTQGRAITRF